MRLEGKNVITNTTVNAVASTTSKRTRSQGRLLSGASAEKSEREILAPPVEFGTGPWRAPARLAVGAGGTPSLGTEGGDGDDFETTGAAGAETPSGIPGGGTISPAGWTISPAGLTISPWVRPGAPGVRQRSTEGVKD